VLSVILTFWFWLQPLFLFDRPVSAKMLFLVQWNPLAHFVALPGLPPAHANAGSERSGGFGGRVPADLCRRGMFFRKTKREFVDVL